MTDPQKTKRRPPIAYRLPVELEDEFDRRVERSGLSVNAFLTQSWHNKPQPRQVRRPPLEKQLLANMLSQLSVIADTIRQEFNRQANPSKPSSDTLTKMYDELRSIRVAIFKALGRKP